MKYKKHSLLMAGAMLLGTGAMLLGACTSNGDEAVLSFAVVSDIHFGDNCGDGYIAKNARALQNLTSYGPLDAFAVAGDITNGGEEYQFKEFVEVYTDSANFLNPVGEMILMMGNHDNYGHPTPQGFYKQYFKVFNGGEEYPMNSYRVIKGYPFIAVSMHHHSAPGSYPAEVQQWLSNALARAAKECPGKPIFVFTHEPPLHTCYSSWAEHEGGVSWAGDLLNDELNAYPQAIVFAGHSHYPLLDPRSIHQGANPNSARRNYYTVVNTASGVFGEIEGTVPPNCGNLTEGLIVRVLLNGNVEIRRYNTYQNVEIDADDRWVVEAPFDGNKFRYASIYDADDNPNGKTLVDGLPAPAFHTHAALEVKAGSYEATVRIPQAKDDKCVVYYQLVMKEKASGSEVANMKVYSEYYRNAEMPAVVEGIVRHLKPGVEYTAMVTAFDSFANASQTLTAAFATMPDNDPANDVPAPLARWTFNNEANLFAPTGGGSLKPQLLLHKGVKCATAKAAGIESVEGPSAANRAIHIPATAALLADFGLRADCKDYTLMMDIRIAKKEYTYNALFQTDLSNTNDADLSIIRTDIGLAPLGYSSMLTLGKWHRVLLVNRAGEFGIVCDTEPLQTARDERWTISKNGALLFADDDGERCDIDVAEVAFWNKPLSQGQINRLGTPE